MCTHTGLGALLYLSNSTTPLTTTLNLMWYTLPMLRGRFKFEKQAGASLRPQSVDMYEYSAAQCVQCPLFSASVFVETAFPILDGTKNMPSICFHCQAWPVDGTRYVAE